jgi:hypothetical protein
LTPAGTERWQRAAGALTRDAGPEVLVLTAALEAPYRLDPAAAAVWREFAAPSTVDEVAERLAARFGVPAPRVADDITPVVRDLAACGALAAVG